jgi:hypothetical protein
MKKIDFVIAEFKHIELTRSFESIGNYLSVYVVLDKSIPVNQRSSYLLSLEDALITQCDSRIRVWHEPIGDKNSLRNFRGVKVL